MKTKRYLSIILCILLALPLGISPVFAGEDADELVINELGGTLSNTSLDTELTLDGSPTAKWLTKGTGGWPFVAIYADLSAYDYLNVQLYSPKATDDTIGISFRTTKNFTAGGTVIDWEGWKTLEIPLSKYAGLKEAGVITYFDMWDQGWDYTYGDAIAGSDKNGSLNIGRIWLSKVSEYVIRENDVMPTSSETCSVDNELTYDGASTLKWTTKGGNNSQVVYSITEDISGYKMFNAQIYSPKATNDTIGIHFHTSKAYTTRLVVVDWEGWKTLQIPLENFKGINFAEVSTFQMWDHGWSYTYGDAISGSDQNGSLNLGKIWLDNSEYVPPEEPDEPDVPDIPDEPDEPADETIEGEYDIAKYDSSFNFGGKLSKDTENVYSQDASAKWDVSSNNNFVYPVEDCDFQDYKYIYATIYVPKVTESVIMFQYLFQGTGYAVTTIPLNFEGWQTLCFPVENTGIGSNKVAKFYVYNNGWNNKIDGLEYINFERIWLSKYDINSCELISSSLIPGYDRVSPVNFEIELGFASKLDSEIVPNAILTDSDGNTTELECTVSGTKLTLTAAQALAYGTKYTLKAENITDVRGNVCNFADTFTTRGLDINATDVEITEGNGGNLTAVSTVANPSDDEKEAVIYICEYTADGKMTGFASETVKIEAGKSEELSAEYTPVSSENTVEAFVTDSTGKPVCERVSVYGTDAAEIEKSSGGNGEVSIDNAKVTAKGIRFGVTVKSPFTVPVTAIVKNANGETVYAKAVMTNADGKADFNAEFSDDMIVSGKHTLSVANGKSAQKASYEFYFSSVNDKNEVYEKLEKATNNSEVADVIEENHSVFGYGEEEISADSTAEFLAEVIGANELPDDFDSVMELVGKAVDLRDKINTCDWNELADIIEENYDILLCSDLKSAFGKLTSDQKSKVAKKLKTNCPYDLFSDFASDLEDFIDDVKSEKKNTGFGGGGGGGGSSTYNVPVTPATSAPDTSETVQAPFDDLEGVSWAKDSVMSLYESGVISPAADKKFRPDDSITREEFAKLICVAFNLEDASAVCDFADVQSDAWYYSVIASMNAKGIITGYGDTFGTGDKITREDMAVIAVRALSYLGKAPENNASVGFADEASVSDYALSAVNTLANAKIINGMGDGNFAPKGNATRAQAAKIICGLMQLVK